MVSVPLPPSPIPSKPLLKYLFRRITLWEALAWFGLTLLGYGCAILSVHGPDFFTYFGQALLFPNYALANMASAWSIFYELNILNVLIFLVLQASYFRVIDWLSYLLDFGTKQLTSRNEARRE